VIVFDPDYQPKPSINKCQERTQEIVEFIQRKESEDAVIELDSQLMKVNRLIAAASTERRFLYDKRQLELIKINLIASRAHMLKKIDQENYKYRWNQFNFDHHAMTKISKMSETELLRIWNSNWDPRASTAQRVSKEFCRRCVQPLSMMKAEAYLVCQHCSNMTRDLTPQQSLGNQQQVKHEKLLSMRQSVLETTAALQKQQQQQQQQQLITATASMTERPPTPLVSLESPIAPRSFIQNVLQDSKKKEQEEKRKPSTRKRKASSPPRESTLNSPTKQKKIKSVETKKQQQQKEKKKTNEKKTVVAGNLDSKHPITFATNTTENATASVTTSTPATSTTTAISTGKEKAKKAMPQKVKKKTPPKKDSDKQKDVERFVKKAKMHLRRFLLDDIKIPAALIMKVHDYIKMNKNSARTNNLLEKYVIEALEQIEEGNTYIYHSARIVSILNTSEFQELNPEEMNEVLDRLEIVFRVHKQVLSNEHISHQMMIYEVLKLMGYDEIAEYFEPSRNNSSFHSQEKVFISLLNHINNLPDKKNLSARIS